MKHILKILSKRNKNKKVLKKKLGQKEVINIKPNIKKTIKLDSMLAVLAMRRAEKRYELKKYQKKEMNHFITKIRRDFWKSHVLRSWVSKAWWYRKFKSGKYSLPHYKHRYKKYLNNKKKQLDSNLNLLILTHRLQERLSPFNRYTTNILEAGWSTPKYKLKFNVKKIVRLFFHNRSKKERGMKPYQLYRKCVTVKRCKKQYLEDLIITNSFLLLYRKNNLQNSLSKNITYYNFWFTKNNSTF